MVIDVNGNVGINTTNPSFNLDVNGSGHYSGSLLVGLTSSNNVGVSNGVATSALTIGSAGGSIYFRDISPGIIQTQTYAFGANTGQIQLQPFGGNVGINTTSPAFTLDVNGSANVSGSTTLGGNVAIKTWIVTGTLAAIGNNVTVNLPSGVTRLNIISMYGVAYYGSVYLFVSFDTRDPNGYWTFYFQNGTPNFLNVQTGSSANQVASQTFRITIITF